jgi:hypothetical protein
MQQSEVFRSGEATIKVLERQLKACANVGRVCEQSAVEATREIEEHFARCINALAARKDALLSEVAEKVNNHSKFLNFHLLKI